MKIKKLICATAVVLVAACSKETEMSNVEKTAIAAQLAEQSMSIAKSMAVINPSHSESYYRSMLLAIIQDCVKKADPESCLRSEIERLKYR
jgi:hypothetical protein